VCLAAEHRVIARFAVQDEAMSYGPDQDAAPFAGGDEGAWSVERIDAVVGDALPRAARRLYHARDLGEPFDFLTWFECAPEDADAFEELVRSLRSREEWSYVEREIAIRLAR
jgi:hypothetical protein